MTSESHSMQDPHAPAGHDSVEMPQPTVAPLVLSVGMAVLASGVAFGVFFILVGVVLLVIGLGMWIADLLPGKGHFHEALVESALRPRPVTPVPGTVQQMETGMAGYRMRLPEKVHPISAGIKGGMWGGAVISIPAAIYSLATGHTVWYPINLLAGMVIPGVENMTVAQLDELNISFLLTGLFIHVVSSLVFGMVYGVLLPTLPPIPQAMAWAALLAPVVWSLVTYLGMGAVNPGLRTGVSWPWFILSQFIYGVVMALVVTQATGLSPLVRGLAGGLLGGLLMPIPAILWSLGTGRGFWYPVNLLAGMMVPGLNDPTALERQFRGDWLAMALLVHLVLSLGFAVACALLLPRLRPIPSPLAWGGLLMPLLWSGASFGLMGVVNPALQQQINWPSFIVSQFIFGVVASIVVVRSEQIAVPPAGQGPDR
jgi:hypothetical protein